MEEAKQQHLIIAEEVRIDDLSGIFKGSVSIGEKETGIVILDGQVEETISPGTNKLGKWKNRTVFRICSGEFTLTFNFFGLRAGDGEPVDAFLLAIIRLQSAEVFYRSVLRGRKSIDVSELGNILSLGLEKPLHSEAAKYQAENLYSDPVPAESIIRELKNILGSYLAERGLTLQKIQSLTFSPSESDDILFEEVEQLRGELETAGKQNRDTAKQMATRLWKKGLISIEEAEEMRSAVSGESQSQGKTIVSMVDTAMSRLENRLMQKAQQLMGQASELETEVSKSRDLAEWGQKDGLKTDEMVRRHIGRTLANSVGDIKQIKLEAHRKGFNEAADSMSRLENDIDLLRTEVEGAAYGSRAVSSKKGKASRQMVARLIQFETDMFNQATDLPFSIQQIRDALLNSNTGLEKSILLSQEALIELRKKFSQRENILQGLMG